MTRASFCARALVALAVSQVFISISWAQATFGQWTVFSTRGESAGVVARTKAESGPQALGMRCFIEQGSCIFILASGISCNEGGKIPVLLNASVGAFQLTGTCYKQDGVDGQLLLSPFDTMETAIKKSVGLLGFAIPMESGKFSAIRLSADGGKEAIEAASMLAVARKNSANPAKTGVTTF